MCEGAVCSCPRPPPEPGDEVESPDAKRVRLEKELAQVDRHHASKRNERAKKTVCNVVKTGLGGFQNHLHRSHPRHRKWWGLANGGEVRDAIFSCSVFMAHLRKEALQVSAAHTYQRKQFKSHSLTHPPPFGFFGRRWLQCTSYGVRRAIRVP